MNDTRPENQKPIINITGEKVALGPMSRDQLALYARWTNDFSVAALGQEPLRPATLESAEADYEHLTRARDRIHFIIYERTALQPIGWLNLREIEREHGIGSLGIAIHDKEYWGKGYGTEATLLTLDYAFSALGLHNIMLDTFSGNERAIRAYLRAGFKEIGRRRQAYRLGGQVYDVVFMDCLATEFKSPLKPVVELS